MGIWGRPVERWGVVYDGLARDRFDGDPPSFSTLPDGSIDRYCSVSLRGGDRLTSRAALGREIASGQRSAFRFAIESTEPGGQSVNVADQLAAFGGDVTCYGHLDADVFEDAPFGTVSMGSPAEVYAFNFAEGDVMFVDESTIGSWSLDDLREVASLEDVLGVDVVCCSNWVSLPGLGPAFHRIGDLDVPRVPFLLDPGDVTGSPGAALEGLRDALAALQGSLDVVLNANRAEIHAIADTLPDPPAGDHRRVAALRDAMGIEAVVMHARDEAAAATRSGVVAVPNVPVDRSYRHTGAGDRFNAGVAYALAQGWEWAHALALGNACAGYFIEAGTSGDPDEVLAFARAAA